MQIKENYLVTQIKDGIIKYVDVNVKIILSVKRITVGILPHAFVKNSKHLKSVFNTSVTECDEYE